MSGHGLDQNMDCFIYLPSVQGQNSAQLQESGRGGMPLGFESG